jgi:hypothetical protein
MRILLYAPHSDDDGTRLETLLTQLAPWGSVERFDSLGAMSRRLQSPPLESRLAVLLAGSREELLNIASFKSAFEGMQILLILPEQDNELLMIAHQLRPRYITYRSDEFSDLIAVLQRKISPGSADPPHGAIASGRKTTRVSRPRLD